MVAPCAAAASLLGSLAQHENVHQCFCGCEQPHGLCSAGAAMMLMHQHPAWLTGLQAGATATGSPPPACLCSTLKRPRR